MREEAARATDLDAVVVAKELTKNGKIARHLRHQRGRGTDEQGQSGHVNV